MMSNAECIEKLSHSCGSSDALQVFHEDTKGYSGYCFACETNVPDPYNGNNIPLAKRKISKTPEQKQAEIDDVDDLPCVALPSRGLTKETLDYFGVKVALSEQDGETPTVRYLPIRLGSEFLGYKAKLMEEKRMWSIGNTSGDKDLFGWHEACLTGAKRLFITEGEEDAMALHQSLVDFSKGGKWEHLKPAVVSLTTGAGGAPREVRRMLPSIKSLFKEVVLVFDQDEAGALATKKVLQIVPDATTVVLPESDPNECLLQGRSKLMAERCLFKSAAPKNTRIVNGSSLREVACIPAEYGESYPWEGLTKLTRGMRFGETYYLGAGVKMGKTTVRSALAAHFLKTHGLDVFMAAPEESNKKSYQLLLGQVAHKVFHDPDIEFDKVAYHKAADFVGDRLRLLNLYQHLGWQTLKSDIIDAAGMGCKVIMIDPITNLTNGISSGEANTQLQGIAQELAVMALDHGLIIWIFCHLKSPDYGVSHERGGRVLSHQFAGSRAMMRSCNMMIGLEGNKDPDEDDETRSTRRLVVLEDREFGASGTISMTYNPLKGILEENKDMHK